MGFSADRRSGRLGFSGPVELCIVVVLVEEGTATTVVLVEFKRSLRIGARGLGLHYAPNNAAKQKRSPGVL